MQSKKIGSQKSSPSNKVLIVIVIVVGFFVILGAGGYFAWKVIISKKISSLSNISTTITPTPDTPTPTLSLSANPASPTPSTELKGGTPINGYLLSNSNTSVISSDEILNFSAWQLKVARNEIYARYGQPFVSKDLECYFATQNWYKINYEFSESSLSQIEYINIAVIQEQEEKINSQLQSHDSGCKI